MGSFRYVGPLASVVMAGEVVEPGGVVEVVDGVVLSADWEPVDKPEPVEQVEPTPAKAGRGKNKDGE